ncbi:MAG: TIGR03663 family protein [Chloroflexi bacterium]|nr:TIGR03663 family protein [Chloroflexota bacterium]
MMQETLAQSSRASEQDTAPRLLGLRITPELLAYVALIAIGATLRFWDLGSRALHHDESLHAYYSWNMYQGHGYQHNPLLHGTFMYHFMALVYFIFGASDYTARIAPAMFGTALIILPYFLRGYLGRWGALAAAAFLTFSPSMLYFSRFAREDIFMAFFTLALVVFIWRYLAERKTTYLYWMAAVLALSFAVKETTFILIVIFGSFMALLWLEGAVKTLSAERRQRKEAEATVQASAPGGAGGGAVEARASSPAPATMRPQPVDFRLSDLTAPGIILLLLITLSLPQWAPLLSKVEGVFGATLVNPADQWQSGPVGAPVGDKAFAIAVGSVVFLLAVSIIVGLGWNRKVWLTIAAIFYGVYVFFFSTQFTHLAGVGTGMWQSLGYWLAQQPVQRGNQPMYYYFIIVPLYESLPFALAVIGSVFYMFRRADIFTWFLVYWIVAAFLLFSWAGEKMPWLSLNLALPIALLGGKFLGEVIERIDWRGLVQRGGLLLLVFFPLVLALLYGIITWGGGDEGRVAASGRLILIVLLLGALTASAALLRRLGPRAALGAIGLPVLLILAGFTVKAAGQASFANGDVPKEMLVYTQTSPDIPQLRDQIERVAMLTGKGKNIRILIDGTSGFQWPWQWYLRDYKNVAYWDFSGTAPVQPDTDIVIVHVNNQQTMQDKEADFGPGRRIKLRWWFPEGYRDYTPRKFFEDIQHSRNWTRLWEYFSFRKLGQDLGSEDAVVYFRKGLPL